MIVEAMKTMNHVPSTSDAVKKKRLAKMSEARQGPGRRDWLQSRSLGI